MSPSPLHRGLLLVLSAPSGTGKTTLARRFVEAHPDADFSISMTTREPRGAEKDGVDYHFVDALTFQRMIERDEFVEWAEVHGNFYGTPRENFEAAAERGAHLVLDIDVQGARQIRKAVADAILVFVIPPSAEVLVSRLTKRGTEPDEEVARRLRAAIRELSSAKDFDHVVVNDDLERAVEEVRSVARTGRSQVDGGIGARIDALVTEMARVLEERFQNVGA